jgi:hypothetical protein
VREEVERGGDDGGLEEGFTKVSAEIETVDGESNGELDWDEERE